MSLNEATLRQIEAADPARNTWLSANAGSGKTRVLTDRVARLLLSGVEPQNILCLTYTKAAASEMQNRLFKRLGEWAMKDANALRDELRDLGVTPPDDLSRARQLFARAIETPGGLKIQTIHAFCAAILRRFPMEAKVTPDFQEMDDRSAKMLQDEILEEMAKGAQRPLVEGLLRHFSGMDLEPFLQEVARHTEDFAAPVEPRDVWGWFDLDPRLDRRTQLEATFAPGDGEMLAALRTLLLGGSSTEVKAAEKLMSIDCADFSFDDIAILEGVLLTGSGAKEPFSAKIGSFPTKGMREGPAAPLMDKLEGLMARVETMRDRRLSLLAAERTLALHQFGHAFTRQYQAAKEARGWLDFDDLIRIAARLLNESALAQWVLYRLDGGIDHILVDEAQDTSPDQWRVIDSLTREFTSGEGTHAERDWSIFVVGDPKQSIYSFQGADPEEFRRMREVFDGRLAAVQRPLQRLPLAYSFRSSPAVLDAVDKALADVRGLGDEALEHKAFHEGKPGRVDIWPAIEKVDYPEPNEWHDPLDVPAPNDHAVVLAESIAEQIAHMIENEQIPEGDGFRPITAGDILILVQRRSEMFHQIIRACKNRELPIAGADVLRIGGEMAVKDLTALLSFLGTPEDDLSLATVLRSPLVGWDEDQLYRLAHGRDGYLWAALREHGGPVVEMLTDLRDNVDFLRPYDLIDRVLLRHDGRRKLVGRLGIEAEDGIDALLSQALAYERMEVPSLTGFLAWLAAEDVTIKRQMDTNPTEIRVMTVHGSKGLEAPIVFLPDTAKRDLRGRGSLDHMNGNLLWKPASKEMPDRMRILVDNAKEKELEERMRLLYVAMTRAESWLVVAAAGDLGSEITQSWHAIIGEGVGGLDPKTVSFPTGLGKRLEVGAWPAPTAQSVEGKGVSAIELPDWAEHPAPKPVEKPKPLIPSDMGGAKVVPGATEGLDGEAAKRRGRQIHRLLEFLPDYPREDWAGHAQALLAFGEDAANEDEVAELMTEIETVLTSDVLRPLFTGDALAEVEVTAPATLAGRERIHGIIDRLVIQDDHILAVDFKSNLVTPDRPEDIPEGILRQLGAYEIALAPLYPGRAIRLAILWTRTATLMELPPGLAARSLVNLDADHAAT